VLIKQKAGLDSNLVWMFWERENSVTPTGRRTPDRAARKLDFTQAVEC